MARQDFPEKLKIVLKALVVSRTGLASALDVDKSLVGRWASGAVTPSEHNLAKITRFVAEKMPGFTLFDWDRSIADFAALFGTSMPGQMPTMADLIPAQLLEEATAGSVKRGALYSGLWRSLRASYDLPGRFIQDILMSYIDDAGVMRFKIGVEGVRYEGWSLLLQHQLFSIAFDHDAGTAMFSIFNGVARQKPQVLDGMNLATLRDAGGSPAASASVLTRIGDLTGDREKDEAMFEEAVSKLNPLVPEDDVDPALAKHLTRTVQGEADGLVRLLFADSIARGSRVDEVARSAR
ncbi:MAG: helix-turn-helix transcriptional regulator [Pseudomonadota bacterium]